MIKRREVLASGIAVSLLSRITAAAIAPPDTGIVPAPNPAATSAGRRFFIAALQLAESRAAAAAAVRAGALSRSLAADVTPVYEWLDVALRSERFSIAGLSSAQAFFVIERLAWDRGLRTVYRGIHRPDADGAASHQLAGSPALVARIRQLDRSDWAAGLGRTLAGAEAEAADKRHLITTAWLPRADDPVLVSWLLLPRDALRA